MPRGPKSSLRGLAVSVGAFVASLVALELAFRWSVGPVQPANRTHVPGALVQDTDLPGVRYVLRPDSEAVQEFGSDPRGYFDPGAQLTYHINSLGFRGPETTREKPEGIFRIVAMGDSILFGTGVRQEDTCTAVLERLLKADGRHCEVQNLGVVGYDTFEEAVLFRRLGLQLDPDLAFFCFFLNDTDAGVAVKAFNETGERSGLRRVSVLYDHVAARASRRAAVRQLVLDYERGFEDENPGWLRAQQALRKAKEAADRKQVPLVLVIFPLLWQLDESYPFAAIHAKVAEAGRGLGFHVLDLLPAFLGKEGTSLWVHPSNQHPNEIGHALAARAIHDFLIDEGLVDER